jgi:hypothetical protein
VIDRTVAGLAALPNTVQMDYTYLNMRMQRWQGRIASSTNRLWPCVSPFSFRSVLEPVLATQASVRRRSGLVRRMLARFQPTWAEFPLEHGYPAMPFGWRNCYRFAPLVRYYGERVLSRIQKHRRWTGPGSHDRPAGWQNVRQTLAARAEARELLDPRTMRSRWLFDHRRLESFVASAAAEGFSYGEQWSRLLTLEHILRRVASPWPETRAGQDSGWQSAARW